MGGTKGLRTALIAGGVLASAAFAFSTATAQQGEPAQPTDAQPADAQSSAIDFTDPAGPIPEGAALNLSVRSDGGDRFSPLDSQTTGAAEGPRRVEVAIAAGGARAPIDISISQRASLGANRNGDVDRQGRGSEVRVGRGLVDQHHDGATRNSTYVFVASDNEALTWQPGARNDFGGQGASLSLQDRVEVGDLSAGVTWEREGVQTSLAYVEREQSTRVGNQNFSQDQSYAGVTVTMRH